MASILKALSSSVGTKVVIAITGLAMVGFLIGHLAGNLLVLAGPDAYNHYSEVLVSNPLLIPVELGLVALLLAHVYKTVAMYGANRQTRPVGYHAKGWAAHTSRKSVASTTMIFTGLVILGFLGLHLKTFKYGPFYDAADGARDLHRLVLEVFSNPFYVAFYVACMALVGFHLRHGIASAFQSLGVDHPRYTPWIGQAGRILAIVIGTGFALIPLWVYFGGGRP